MFSGIAQYLYTIIPLKCQYEEVLAYVPAISNFVASFAITNTNVNPTMTNVNDSYQPLKVKRILREQDPYKSVAESLTNKTV